jgi:hypothetical protein
MTATATGGSVRARRSALLLALCVACSGSADRSTTPPPPDLPADAGSAPAANLPDAGPVLGEAEARAVMSARFRAEGHRIVQDVPVGGAVLDGADPANRIGYEYIAAEEAEHVVIPDDATWTVLVVKSTSAELLARALDRFFTERTASDPKRQPR